MATTNDLKNGMVLNLDGQLWSVIWFQHHKPGKGGAVVRTKLKNIESGKTVDKTFNADVKVEVASVDKRTMQYLYNDGVSFVFMDTSSYEQLEVPPESTAEISVAAGLAGAAAAIELTSDQPVTGSVLSEAIGTDAGQGVHLRPPYPCHYYMHGAGRYGLQCLTNLDLLPPTGALLICPPLKIERGSGSPLRVLALVE